jgi:hypothetical protein
MRRRMLVSGLVLACAACVDEGGDPDPGLHLLLRVRGAQLVRGPLAAANGGPAVSQIERPEPQVRRGQSDVVVKGRLAEGGVAIHVQLEGDRDHWVKPARIFDDVVDTELTWSAALDFSPDIPSSTTARVLLQATDVEGRHGEVSSTTFMLLPDPPQSALTVALAWTRPADLDLHLVTPDGIDINPKNINSFVPAPPGMVDPPDAWRMGALLDFDSNQECRIDGRGLERIAYQTVPPPPGLYRVYVNLFAPCGESAAPFRVAVIRDGVLSKEVVGTLYDFDARMEPREGEAPGLFVTEIQVE